ncbi:hypothetical protein ACJA88_009341 [Fusarium oxysporum]
MYYFIIVGGETTGLILADRLSESGEKKVLVLEAAPDPNVVAMHQATVAVEYIAGQSKPNIDWNFYTEPQEGLDDRKLAYHRGRGLGGSSILNGFYYRFRDLNNGRNLGVKQGTATLTSKYRRSSAYDYYNAAAKRPNVDIFHNAPVQQIMFSRSATGVLVATGVSFIDHSQVVTAGIGPQATLDAFNIEPVVINENAGQHMMDHNLYSISATVVPESSAHQLMFNSTAVEASQEEYYTTGKGYYTHPADRAIAFNAFRDARKILDHCAFANLTVGPNHREAAPGVINIDSDDDEAIFDYIKATTVPNLHASGTNRMLPLEDGGVVDSRIHVYGVQGFRNIDSNIMPTGPDVNIAGPVYMVGEHGATMIKKDWGI